MSTLLPPGMSRWVLTAARVLVAAVPALVAVVIGMLILLIGLALGEQRRAYALRAARVATDLAKTLIGPTGEIEQKVTQSKSDRLDEVEQQPRLNDD